MELFNHLPPHLREQAHEAVKGQRAVRFPCGYFRKAPEAMNIGWQNVAQVDSEGFVTKTAPDRLINLLIKWLDKLELEYEVIKL